MNEEEEKDESATEVLDFNRPDFEFKPKENHNWIQQGPYLVCKSCEIEHATYIGMGKIMVGLNDQGQPLFKRR
jgi:hypothetical protein